MDCRLNLRNRVGIEASGVRRMNPIETYIYPKLTRVMIDCYSHRWS